MADRITDLEKAFQGWIDWCDSINKILLDHEERIKKLEDLEKRVNYLEITTGKYIRKRCELCQSLNPATATYCGHCGTKFKEGKNMDDDLIKKKSKQSIKSSR